MLEDGEIDEEDLELTTTTENLDANVNHINNNNNNNINGNNEINNKRKTRDTKLNKRKKQAKNLKLLINSDDENNKDDECQHNDQDERSTYTLGQQLQPLLSLPNQKTKFPSLMSATATPNLTAATSSWSTPLSKKDLTDHKPVPSAGTSSQAPKSLFDLFIGASTSINVDQSEIESQQANVAFIDPVITEKENSKPNKFQKKLNDPSQTSLNGQHNQPGTSQLISIESIEKKMEKKRKYTEIQKEKQKLKEQKQQQQPVVREPIICKFFIEGRCQKGNECPFSHNTPMNKKLEPCKYYLNGFCAKNEKCLFMHADFPCKFFHRKNNNNNNKSSCLHGDQCRFSHEPISNPLLLEALNKHIESTSNANTNNSNQQIAINDDTKKSSMSLLGSPPHSLQIFKASTEVDNQSAVPIPSLMSLMSVSVPQLNSADANRVAPVSPQTAQYPSSPPSSSSSLIAAASSVARINKKQPLLATPTNMIPSLLSNSFTPQVSASQDIDERSVAVKQTALPLTLTSVQSYDIDERNSVLKPSTTVTTTTTTTTAAAASLINNDVSNENLKQELIIRIMKAIATENGESNTNAMGLPKNTLTELLVKLLNEKESSLSNEVILNLLSSLGDTTPSNNINTSNNQPQYLSDAMLDAQFLSNSNLNESSSNLEIDLNRANAKQPRGRGFGKKKFDEGELILMFQTSKNLAHLIH
jgi:hypothetical protein